MNLKILIYCTKDKPYLFNENIYENFDSKYITSNHGFHKGKDYILNGKIVAECDFEVKKFDFGSERFYEGDIEKYNIEINKKNELLKRSCLTAIQMVCYLDKEGLGETNLNGFAIHLKNLHIFDEPKELSNYYKTFERTCCVIKGIPHFVDDCDVLKKAPQNMCYAYDSKGNKYVVMSTQPQWVCLILNGLKDVEVRRKVLKEMIL